MKSAIYIETRRGKPPPRDAFARALAGFALVLFVILFSIAFAEDGAARPTGGVGAPVLLRSDGVDYQYYPPGRDSSSPAATTAELRSVLADFDGLFRNARARVFQMHGQPEPRGLMVALAGNAAIFRRLTGYPWYVAGLYDPNRKRLVFQNPAALRRRGILRSTVAHELCHVSIARAFAQSQPPQASQAMRSADNVSVATSRAPVWLEEGYCEALAESACEADRLETNRLIRDASNLNEFSDWLNTRLGVRGNSDSDAYSAPQAKVSRRDRRLAFCVAALFAQDWTSTVGRDRAFAYLSGTRSAIDRLAPAPSVDREQEGRKALERFYRRFRDKFR